ncbi:MAG TPA: CHAT domain-containing protein [Planctomycetota bacterium]|nr:CHAT domain-containing protein [Planctomycetota bacterium]
MAKRVGELLEVENGAPGLNPLQSGDAAASHVVVLDDHDPLAQVLAANYASSLRADLAVIPEGEDVVCAHVYQELDERARFRGDTRGERALKSLGSLRASLTSHLAFGQREFVTFITRGIPYGYFYREAPSTHLFSQPHLGELIIAGIYTAEIGAECFAAVLIDPGHFGSSETGAIATTLRDKGVVVEVLAGEDAAVDRTMDYICAYPYDLLFICSHCGELPGIRSKIKVPDSEGCMHIVEIEETPSFSSLALKASPSELIEVFVLLRPVAIDGIPWHSTGPELKRHYGAVFSCLRKTPPTEREVLSRERVSHAQFTTGIWLSDGPFILRSVQTVDTALSPVVFNNACVSYYDGAQALTFAGARSYVGTLAPVPTVAAQRLAERVFAGFDKEQPLAHALWGAQSEVFADPDDRTYIHVGCHFNTVRAPHRDAPTAVKERIRGAKSKYAQFVRKHDGEAVTLSHRFLHFLSQFGD